MPPVRSIDGLHGVAIVTRAGSVELEHAGGLADARAGVECTLQTRFQIASVSKQFAAAAVMLLADSGALAPGEPVERWLPGCLPQWRQMTLHHLLTHTAGIAHWGQAPGFDPSQPMSPEERLALIQQAPLLTEPGTQWHYSSPGYLLVGHIVGRASGQQYANVLTERILAPLRLTATTVGAAPADATVARGYRDGQLVTPWELSAMPGTGDICSTAGDLARFAFALHSGSLLTDSSLRVVLAAHAALRRDSHSSGIWLSDAYGYGHFIGRIAGHTAYFHPGDNPGYQSFSAWLPEHAASVIILTNDETSNLDNVLTQVLPAALQS